MHCLIGCLSLLTPRLAILLVFFFSNYIGRAYEAALWPLLGFVFMPLATLAYAWAVNTNTTVTGIYLVVVVGIGLWVGRGQKDTEDYFLAGRSMGWFPIGISTIASLYSARIDAP